MTLTLGDTGPYAHDLMGVFLEGVQVGTVSTAAGQVTTVTFRAQVKDGQLTVGLLDLGGSDANVVINYRADLGAVRAYGAEVRAGSELTGQVTDPQPVERGHHTLTLDLSVDAGNIEVQR